MIPKRLRAIICSFSKFNEIIEEPASDHKCAKLTPFDIGVGKKFSTLNKSPLGMEQRDGDNN